MHSQDYGLRLNISLFARENQAVLLLYDTAHMTENDVTGGHA